MTYLDVQDGEKLLLRQFDYEGKLDAEILMDRNVALDLAKVIFEIMGNLDRNEESINE